MRQGFFDQHWVDQHTGASAGGVSTGRGVTISWQNGPLGRCTSKCGVGPGVSNPRWHDPEGCTRREPNGAFVEDVIEMVVKRIEYYQTAASGRFACEENERAIMHLRTALLALDQRTKAREARGVEGTHQS